MHQTAAHAEDFRLAVHRDLDVPDLVALLNRREEMLHAVLDPFHRPLEDAGRGSDRDLFRIDEELGAEAAADVGRRHADAVLRHAEELRERHPQVVRHLRGRPHGEPVLAGLVTRHRAAALDRVRRAAVLVEPLAKDVRRVREGVSRIAVRDAKLREHVRVRLAPHLGRARRERRVEVRDGRQRFIVDLDRGGGVFGEVARPRHDHRDRLAHEARFARREHERRDVFRQRGGGEAERHAQAHAGLLQLGGGEHRGDLPRSRRIDRADECMRMRAAHEGGMQHARQVDVGSEAPAAAQESRILDALRAGSDNPHFCVRAAASSAAATMFW